MPAIFKRLNGQQGRIDIPDLGAPIGNISSWTLTRRGDAENNSRDEEAEFFDLRAVLQFVIEALFNDPDYEKRVIVQAGKSQTYRLDPVEGPGQRTVLIGRNLTMERVALCRLER